MGNDGLQVDIRDGYCAQFLQNSEIARYVKASLLKLLQSRAQIKSYRRASAMAKSV